MRVIYIDDNYDFASNIMWIVFCLLELYGRVSSYIGDLERVLLLSCTPFYDK